MLQFFSIFVLDERFFWFVEIPPVSSPLCCFRKGLAISDEADRAVLQCSRCCCWADWGPSAASAETPPSFWPDGCLLRIAELVTTRSLHQNHRAGTCLFICHQTRTTLKNVTCWRLGLRSRLSSFMMLLRSKMRVWVSSELMKLGSSFCTPRPVRSTTGPAGLGVRRQNTWISLFVHKSISHWFTERTKSWHYIKKKMSQMYH